MAIYIECPKCHRKQALKNSSCRNCKIDLHSLRKRNQASYWVYLRYRGKQIWERIGPCLTVAREREAKIKASLVADEYQSHLDQATRLKSFFEKLYLPWAKRSKKSWDYDRMRFYKHVLPFFGDIRLRDIEVRDIERFKEHRLGDGCKNATVNRDLALLRALFNKAIKWGKYSGTNPVSIAGLLPENNEHVARFLSKDEAQRLLEALPPETRPIFEFALATGIRIGNILDLKWTQIDINSRIIHLPRTKSGRALRLPLSDWALSILERIPRHIRSEYVFCRSIDGKRYKDIHGGFKNALKRAGLDPRIRIHDLRHTYASWMVAEGVPTALLKELMGHSTMAMVARYTHAGHRTLLEMSNRLSPPFGKHANQYANNQANDKK